MKRFLIFTLVYPVGMILWWFAVYSSEKPMIFYVPVFDLPYSVYPFVLISGFIVSIIYLIRLKKRSEHLGFAVTALIVNGIIVLLYGWAFLLFFFSLDDIIF